MKVHSPAFHGSGDSQNPIGKKLPTKPSKSFKRKGSDTPVSSPQDEAIPTSPISTRHQLNGFEEGVSHLISNIQEECNPEGEGDAILEGTNQLVAIQLAITNNKMLKQILSTLAAPSRPPTSSNPMGVKVPADAIKKGENKIMRWLYDVEHRTIFLQREDGSLENIKEYDSLSSGSPNIFNSHDRQWLLRNDMENLKTAKAQDIIQRGQYQAPVETEISKPLPASAEPIFTSVATESSSAATEPFNKEKAKGNMPLIEEEVQEDVSEPITTDPHSIILGTNMPLGLADV
ncbi:hypothetical protein L1987_23464 [Smallanthus sonchifolius]|uniref:Uncharacterized protein n=1 Tax=Smallanthus sonchifolius TaxID=185202 RepID=A0ACB9IH01_9ASTR|nr:hypothetical protein L1987_23464 [Smallanthus sonchifolius]